MDIGVSIIVAVTTLLVSLGSLAFWCILGTMWYMDNYRHREEECNYTGRLLQVGWRESAFWPWLRRLLGHTLEASAFPTEPCVYVCQPHGILALSAALTFLSGAADQPGVRVVLAVHDWYFRLTVPACVRPLATWLGVDRLPVPGLRNLMLALGCIDKSRESIVNALCNGFNVAILPGGVFEMGPPVVEARRPFGIVKLGHAYRIPLVPVSLNGEERVCWVWEREPQWNKTLRRKTLRCCGLGMFTPFCPRVWAWPTLVTRVGTVLPQVKTVEETQKEYEASLIVLTQTATEKDKHA